MNHLNGRFASTLLDLTSPSKLRASYLSTRDRHRFLWKLPSKPTSRLLELYPSFLEDTNGRIRLEKWIDYPHAVLQHPNTLAILHHGGANSFAEAAWFAIPQIVLPQWVRGYRRILYILFERSLMLTCPVNGTVPHRLTATILPHSSSSMA